MYRFREHLASYYTELSKEILEATLNADVIHIDETSVKLRKTMGYVWVISSASDVCYLFRDSREGTFLKELLGTYQGTLVSDFSQPMIHLNVFSGNALYILCEI